MGKFYFNSEYMFFVFFLLNLDVNYYIRYYIVFFLFGVGWDYVVGRINVICVLLVKLRLFFRV